jgi:hypothetical protein
MRNIFLILLILSVFSGICFAMSNPAPKPPIELNFNNAITNASSIVTYPIASSEAINKYFEGSPDLSIEVKEAILKGHVLIGMNQKEVRLIYGEPIKRIVEQKKTGQVEVWEYSPGWRQTGYRGLIAFKNFTVVAIYDNYNSNQINAENLMNKIN